MGLTKAQLLLLDRLLCRVVAGVAITRIAAPLLIASLLGNIKAAIMQTVL